MLHAVFGRRCAKRAGGASTLRLDMSIGGAETQNLLALYHVANGGLPARPASEDPKP